MSEPLICKTCDKQYKQPRSFIKHQKECISKRIEQKDDTTQAEFVSEFKHRQQQEAYDNEDNNDNENEMVEGITLPSVTGISEDITMSTATIEAVMNNFLTQVFDFQQRQTQQLVNQNIQLIHENKILATTVRSIVASKPESMKEFMNEQSRS